MGTVCFWPSVGGALSEALDKQYTQYMFNNVYILRKPAFVEGAS